MFLNIFNGKDEGGLILALLKELKRRRVRSHTSIITIEEISVEHFRKGRMATENYSKVHKFAKIEGITKEVALTTAKLEAALLDSAHTLNDEQKAKENKRRRWDLFHVATALSLQCSALYCSDDDFVSRQERLGIKGMSFLKPVPENFPLDLQPSIVVPIDQAAPGAKLK